MANRHRRSPEIDTIDGVHPDGGLKPVANRNPSRVSWTEARDCGYLGKHCPRKPNGKKPQEAAVKGRPNSMRPGRFGPLPGAVNSSCTLANHNISVHCRRSAHPTRWLPVTMAPTRALRTPLRAMSGNMWPMSTIPIYSSESRPIDPLGPTPTESDHHVLRGGSWNTSYQYASRQSIQRYGDGLCCRHSMCPSIHPTSDENDTIPAMEMVTLSGTISREGGAALTGRALYVTAFDSTDADPSSGMLTRDAHHG